MSKHLRVLREAGVVGAGHRTLTFVRTLRRPPADAWSALVSPAPLAATADS